MTDIAKRLREWAQYLNALQDNMQANNADMMMDKCKAPEIVAEEMLEAAALLDAPEVGEGELRRVLADAVRAENLPMPVNISVFNNAAQMEAYKIMEQRYVELYAAALAALRSISRRTGGEVTEAAINEAYDAWFYGQEGFSVRSERAFDDIAPGNNTALSTWLREAFKQGHTAVLKTGEGQ